ncbi:MAG: cytochrome c [Blastochloris sp.]|nr:cytochrome c [Blastochloris sp.]
MSSEPNPPSDAANEFQEQENPALRGIDYSESTNVNQIHESILREKVDPQEGEEPISLVLIGIIGVTLLFGGIYLGRYWGAFDGMIYDERARSVVAGAATGGGAGAAGAPAAAEDPVAVALKLGKRVYTANCASCHQGSGQGAAGQYPPLVASDYVLQSERRLIALLLHGAEGPMTVKGNVYNGAMPAWEKQLNDKQMAAVATYIRQEWGNNGGPITPEQVAAARVEFASQTKAYNEAQLLAIDGPIVVK